VFLVLGAVGSLGDRDPDAASTAVVATPTPIATSTPTSTPAPNPTSAATPATPVPSAPIATVAPIVVEPLEITSPAPGSTVTSGQVVITGTAPAGARIVRDIPFAFDETTVADAAGGWQMVVDLTEGANELVFRIGDDQAGAVAIGLTYAPPVSEEPEQTPEPAPAFATIEDGTWFVGDEVAPGTYRLREPPFFCYWARLGGFSGSLGDIKANGTESSYAVVTIGSKDTGFESSGCGTWTKDLSRVTASRTQFGAGTFIVGTDIKPGTYRSSGGGTCYWARLRNFGGALGGIIANGLASSRAVVTIRSTDRGFTSSGCGSWTRR
jgi:hypothetical protein